MTLEGASQALFEAVVAGGVAIIAWIFNEMRREVIEVKTSILALNTKIGEILINLENHKVRIESLEDRS